jgi:hypothetical protein
VLYGHFLREVGRQAEDDAYRQALEVARFRSRLLSLANLKTFQFAADSPRWRRSWHCPTCAVRRLHLEFAPAGFLEDDTGHESSFEHFTRGNALRSRSWSIIRKW